MGEARLPSGKLVGLILSVLVVVPAPLLRAEQASGADLAFSRLSGLAGNWKRAGTDGTQFRIEFELTANDTVLVERWVHDGRTHSLTVYHLDGEALMATHYCPQGNQPRLKMEGGLDENRVTFDFHDATNLQSLEQSHQHRLSFDLSNMGLVIRGEVYRKGTSENQTEMTLERIP